jgi:hypothetical protein
MLILDTIGTCGGICLACLMSFSIAYCSSYLVLWLTEWFLERHGMVLILNDIHLMSWNGKVIFVYANMLINTALTYITIIGSVMFLYIFKNCHKKT